MIEQRNLEENKTRKFFNFSLFFLDDFGGNKQQIINDNCERMMREQRLDREVRNGEGRKK